jgi:hypothetical protein
MTDNAGKFAFSNVPAGTYRLLATLDGYVRQEYGQRVFPGQGTPLNLSTDEVLKDLTIRLTPAGNVSGRLVDNLGKPAVGVPLQLMKAVYTSAGLRSFQTVGNVRTNDRGEYRLYWMTPGRYYLAAGTPQGPAGGGFGFGERTSPNESGDSYTFMFYPGVTDIARAVAIDVRPDGDFVADFVVPKQQLYTIRGRVVIPASTVAPPSASIALAFQPLNGQNSMFSRNPIYNGATGSFELREVIPGPYVIFANTVAGSARAPVDVVNADIDGITLVVNAGLSIAGRVSVEGGSLPAAGVRFQFRPLVGGSPSMVGNLPNNSQVNPDGTFRIDNVLPGHYRIVPPTLQDLYIKQMRFDRMDALNQPVEAVQRGQDAPFLDVVFSGNVSQIEGIVSDTRLQPVAGAQVVLIPDANRDRVDLYKTVTTDQLGRFTLRGVAPGDFKLFAWESLEPNSYFDPDVVRRAEPSGKSVKVSESSKLSIGLAVIPAD